MTTDETAVEPIPGTASAAIVVRDCGANVWLAVTTFPASVRYDTVTGTGTALGLATRMSVLKNVPVDPSAMWKSTGCAASPLIGDGCPDRADRRGGPGAEVDGVQRGGAGHLQRRERRPVECGDVEAERRARVHPERADRRDEARVRARDAVGSALPHEGVARGVDAEQRRPDRPVNVVRVGRADNGASGRVERRVGAGHDTGVGMQPEVLSRVAHDPETIDDRIEIDAERRPGQRRRERRRPHLRRGASRGVETIQPARAAERVELSRRLTEVDAEHVLSGLQSRDRGRGDDGARKRAMEPDELIGRRHAVERGAAGQDRETTQDGARADRADQRGGAGREIHRVER